MEVLRMQYESERIEYKSQMIDDIYKEVIAFANTDGGVIYLGIDDKGNLIAHSGTSNISSSRRFCGQSNILSLFVMHSLSNS